MGYIVLPLTLLGGCMYPMHEIIIEDISAMVIKLHIYQLVLA